MALERGLEQLGQDLVGCVVESVVEALSEVKWTVTRVLRDMSCG